MKTLFSVIALTLFMIFLLKLNDEFSKTAAYEYTCKDYICEVYFTDIIQDDSEYIGLFNMIEHANKISIINIHLSGYGGQVQTMFHLANVILRSKAQVNTIVEGPVYSAHAFIAMLGHNITVMPNTLLMFHEPAILDPNTKDYVTLEEYCLNKVGHKDRGQDAYWKCKEDSEIYMHLSDQFFSEYVYPYLSKIEIIRIQQGYNVTILGTEMIKRIARVKTPHV